MAQAEDLQGLTAGERKERHREACARYRSRHKGGLRKKARAYQTLNRERLREKGVLYRQAHRERYRLLKLARDETRREELAVENKAWRLKYPERVRAQKKLQRAVASGRIQKCPCGVCGAIEAQGHHEDYSKPLDVTWLCPSHHQLRHREDRA